MKGVGFERSRQIRFLSRNPIVPGAFGQPDSDPKGFQEKPLSNRYLRPVPQTDTGSQGENPEALGRIMAKELGKIAP